MPQWRLPSVRWPLLLLLASLGFTTLGVVEANRAIRSQRTVAERALHDYAGFAAWSYGQHLRELFNTATQEVLGPVNHGEGMHTNPSVPPAGQLPHYLAFDARCGCHRSRAGLTPSMYYAWVLGSDTLGVALNTHPNPTEGWEVDRPLAVEFANDKSLYYTAEEKRWINDTLTRQIHSRRSSGRFPMVVAMHDSVPRVLVYTLMPTAWGDTLVYGVEYSRRAFSAATFAGGIAIRELVQLQVTDARGRRLFESEPVKEWTFDDTTRMAPEYGSMLVRAQINPTMAGHLIIGGLPKSRLPFLLGLLAVSAALSLVSMAQIRREGELARLRAGFVASISHELRTPLAQMRLYLETLRLGRFNTEEQRRWSLDTVERETTRLSHLVERVLRFSRTGRPDEDVRDFVDPTAEVQRITEEFQPLAAARGARVTVNATPVPQLMMKPAALRHVLLNLLDNAVKYGPADQTIHVSLTRVDDEVRLEVRDEGPGIAAHDRDAVWRPYERGKTAGHTAGSGLGLSIVRDVAEQHGGRAWIADAHTGSAGAVFVVAFPLTSQPLAGTTRGSLSGNMEQVIT